ncbi:hypothetical protein IG631_01452 [Alternaria alternata]|nr:hypothetical protein IG631_01452 [Alternaria alternata]
MLFARVVHDVMGAAWRERASVGEDCLEVGALNSGILNLGARKASTDQCSGADVGLSTPGDSAYLVLYRFSSKENSAFTWACSSLGFAGGDDAAGVVDAGD